MFPAGTTAIDNMGALTGPLPKQTSNMVTTTVTVNPSLSVAKALTSNDDEDGSFSVTLNDTLNYTVTVTNTGNVTLSNVVASDDLTATSTACATVAPGGTCVLLASYVVTQADVDAGQVVNVGTGDSDETPPTTDPHTEVVPQVPSLSVVKALTSNDDEDGSFSVTLNDTLNYTVTVTNTGNVTLSNVLVSDEPDGDEHGVCDGGAGRDLRAAGQLRGDAGGCGRGAGGQRGHGRQ